MVDVARSPNAEADLQAVFDYGAARWGVDAALAFVFGFEDAFALLAEHPAIGRERGELATDVRSWLHRGYVLYYRISGEQIDILRVIHGAADAVASELWQ